MALYTGALKQTPTLWCDINLLVAQQAKQCHNRVDGLSYELHVWCCCIVDLESCQQRALREEMRIVAEKAVVVAEQFKI